MKTERRREGERGRERGWEGLRKRRKEGREGGKERNME